MAWRPSPIVATNSSKQGNKSTGGSLEIRKALAQILNLHVCMKDRPKMSMVTQQQLTKRPAKNVACYEYKYVTSGKHTS